jgi:hypothetical protein
MPASVSVKTRVAAAPEQLYAMVADVTRMSEWSPETIACRWLGGAAGAAVGARFEGVNRHAGSTWKTVCEVSVAEPGRAFAFEVVAVRLLRVALWRYEFAAVDGGTELTEHWTDRRGALLRWHGRRVQHIDDRGEHNRAGMAATLARIKAVAES